MNDVKLLGHSMLSINGETIVVFVEVYEAIESLQKQLKTVEKISEDTATQRNEYMAKVHNLEEENKRLRDALEKIGSRLYSEGQCHKTAREALKAQ